MRPLPLLPLTFAATFGVALLVAACATTFENPAGPYQGDVMLYHVEKDVPAAVGIVDAVFKFEFDNRATLPAEVRELVRQMRVKFPPVVDTINTARDEYVAAKAAFAAVKEASAVEAAALQLDAKLAALKEKTDIVTWALNLANELARKYNIPRPPR